VNESFNYPLHPKVSDPMTKIYLSVLTGLFLLLTSMPVSASVEKPTPADVVAPKKQVEIRAKVHYVGNSYTRLPNCLIMGTTVYYPYEGCYIVRDCERYNLDFQPPMELVDQQDLNGKTLILTGYFIHRCGGMENPEQPVFVVTGYRAAS
jgi:hypothetical protein